MKNTKKSVFAAVVSISTVLFALCVNSREVIEGKEDKQNAEEEAVFFCKLMPWACVARTSGNGGGKEPPK
jgi:hypothetical protein